MASSIGFLNQKSLNKQQYSYSKLDQIKESYEGGKNGNPSGEEIGRPSQQQQFVINNNQQYERTQEEDYNSNSNLKTQPSSLQPQHHMIHPDKVVTASGQIINRPKSKQQAKKQRQQQQNAQGQGHHSKFSELRKLQSQNTKSNKALDALKSVQQQELLNQ